MIPQLAEKWRILEAERNSFWQIIEQASPRQQVFKPAPDTWSMLEVAQHIVASEKGTLSFLKNRPPVKPDSWSQKIKSAWRAFMLKNALRLPFKFKAPNVPGLSPTAIIPKEDTQVEWQQVREGLEAYLAAFPADQMTYIVFKHPVGGKFTLSQTIDSFLLPHIRHHKTQLNRIAQSEGFPS